MRLLYFFGLLTFPGHGGEPIHSLARDLNVTVFAQKCLRVLTFEHWSNFNWLCHFSIPRREKNIKHPQAGVVQILRPFLLQTVIVRHPVCISRASQAYSE